MEIMELLRTRRTYRRFDQSRPVPEEALTDMMEAARLSSSAANLQQLHFLVARSPELVEKIFPLTFWAAALPRDVGRPGQGKHPVMYWMILTSKSQRNSWTDIDIGIAASNITMAAWSHGVGSCIMGAIDRKGIADVLKLHGNLKLDGDQELHSVIAFGYPTHSSTVVSPDESGGLKYYIDEKDNFYVPKREISDFIQILD